MGENRNESTENEFVCSFLSFFSNLKDILEDEY